MLLAVFRISLKVFARLDAGSRFIFSQTSLFHVLMCSIIYERYFSSPPIIRTDSCCSTGYNDTIQTIDRIWSGASELDIFIIYAVYTVCMDTIAVVGGGGSGGGWGLGN